MLAPPKISPLSAGTSGNSLAAANLVKSNCSSKNFLLAFVKVTLELRMFTVLPLEVPAKLREPPTSLKVLVKLFRFKVLLATVAPTRLPEVSLPKYIKTE